MRFTEFKLIEQAQAKFYTIGDSHAEAIATAGGRDWVNLAIAGRSSTDSEMLANIAKVPRGAVVLVSQGANDTAIAMQTHIASKGARPLKKPQEIARNVAAVVDKVQAQGATVIFMLFPNGSGRGAGLAKYYSGDYQEEVRSAIKAAIGNVKVIDINGKPLTDGVHATMGVYKDVANQVRALSGSGVQLGNTSGKPGAPTTKDKGAGTKPNFVLDVPKGRRGTEVADIQKALVALGYPLPKHGVDGIRGPETVAAVKKFQNDNGLTVDGDPGPLTVAKLNDILKSKPDIASKLTKSTSSDVKTSPTATNVDTGAIQDPDFNKKLEKVANKLGIDSNDLYKIIKFETAGTFSPKSQDPNGVSIGLIGFTERTANSLGTSKAELGKMTAVEQLDYVYKFYKMVGVRPGDDRGTIYMLTFMPAFAHSPDNTVLGKKGGGTLILPSGKSAGLSMHKVWEQNPAFSDRFKRDSFTVGDVKNKINSR